MPDVIYVDVLIIVNFIVNYFMLLAVGVICSLEKNRKKIISSALAGALCSLTVFIDFSNGYLALALRIALPFIMTALAFRYRSLKNYLINTFFLFLISFVFSGIIFALIVGFSPKGINCFNGFFYFDINPAALFIMTVFCYLIISFGKRIFAAKKPEHRIYRVIIQRKGRKITLDGFVDSGNKLTEPFSGYPCAVCGLRQLKPLLTDEEYDLLQDKSEFQCPQGFKLIPYSSVGKTGLLRGFVPESFCLIKNGYLYYADEITVAVSDDRYMSEDFNIILPQDMITEKCESLINMYAEHFQNEKERF